MLVKRARVFWAPVYHLNLKCSLDKVNCSRNCDNFITPRIFLNKIWSWWHLRRLSPTSRCPYSYLMKGCLLTRPSGFIVHEWGPSGDIVTPGCSDNIHTWSWQFNVVAIDLYRGCCVSRSMFWFGAFMVIVMIVTDGWVDEWIDGWMDLYICFVFRGPESKYMYKFAVNHCLLQRSVGSQIKLSLLDKTSLSYWLFLDNTVDGYCVFNATCSLFC